MSESRKVDDAKKDGIQKSAGMPPKEVFDSSRYDAMDDMTKGASAAELTDTQAIVDLEKEEPMKPEGINDNSLTLENASKAPSRAKVNPIIAEERARTIREINEEATPDVRNNQDVSAVERHDYGTTVWTEDAMQHYVQMVNAGVELYAQFVKNATEIMDSWLRSWYPNNRQ